MPIHAALHHRTRYRYDRPVSHSPHIVRLRPAPHCRTPILSYSLRISPARHFINWQQDPLGNHVARIVFPEPCRELDITVDLVAEMAVYNPFDFFLEPEAEQAPFSYDARLSGELAPFLACANGGDELEAFAAAHPPRGRTVDYLVGLNHAVMERVRYLIRMEPGVQEPAETLRLGCGSCRDSAWLLVQLLRRLGFAARFVSGYLIQLAPDVKPLDGPAGPAEDFTDLHAWCEVFLPGAGWVGLDPTSGLLAGEGHIPLACSPNPTAAAPVSGAVDACESTMEHEMSVSRVFESPRVTRPYTDAQWSAVHELGRLIDARLDEGDVRLTMGGEPTFVSIDDVDGAEWNTAALGPAKRTLGDRLIVRLRDTLAPGGLLFHGQGKWYPGESLPRWAFSCHWREDGAPLWKDPRLVADLSAPGSLGIEDAGRFARALTAVLGVEERWLQPAYEDVAYYLWKERRLPANVDPLHSNLRDPEARARIARVFEQGLGTAVGWVLPLQPASVLGRRWRSGPWFLRDDTLWLLPGDSPMGYRLPLESLPWVSEQEYPWVVPVDPMVRATPLPPTFAHQHPPESGIPGTGSAPESAADLRRPQAGESARWIVRTALCVEPREGRLHVFLPPLRELETYLDLVSSIESVAATLGVAVVLEGTPPPRDPRLISVRVTPDPGVLEVNVPPAHSWDELVRITEVVYEQARLLRLGTEKFMLDGRHSGTGGGNHIVIGASHPSDSPLLRRPDLLRSLVAYWQNHPSLSYLFSGLFIGPTSQHPRVDEARNDSLHELELAFQRTPRAGDPCPPWLVDRLFRNLLVDATGNTHRAEFSIDKLYSPDGPGGRLGLLELRSFEMPPHPRMSLVQQLLLRGLVARFWETPYANGPVRWSTALHDRFMLPHFVRQDFLDVLDELRAHGFGFESTWFEPHFEFRFPFVGEIARLGMRLELRTALEPWHVLGEESGAGGTVRYVDSSVERLQVRVSGLLGQRYALACNGRRVPLQPTGTAGEAVAGIRYRAWQPPNCLHPTIPVATPLVFDIVDTWNSRSIGGCTAHVMHPGGRNYTTFPVNAFEAESRRLARFFPHGHTPGAMVLPPDERNPDFPFTLDLRRTAPF
ncbi:hypothetical protein GALL_53430 [mine drainage metagenome]|uniref:Transglutaminase-like domain-containing protein n=1 Tax=mine drainage metagenome TaxID=410659 RepID=A0A1J5TNF7_9ZZZZ